jgi:OPT oligopeptide transporter protein
VSLWLDETSFIRFTSLSSLIFAGVQLMPPATSINYVPWAVVGFIFQYVIRRRYFPFWAKYNCEPVISFVSSSPLWQRLVDVLSAALDAGTAVGVLIVYFWSVFLGSLWTTTHSHFLSLQYPLRGDIGENTIQTWWGNTVFKRTADWRDMPLKSVSDGGTFGYVYFCAIEDLTHDHC